MMDNCVTQQPAHTTVFNLRHAAPTIDDASERRDGERHLTLYRVGSMIVEGRRELCLIKNISAGGMMVRLYGPVADDTRAIVELKCGQQVQGRICWTRNNLAGVTFDEPVDIIDLLSSSSQGPRPRMPRIALDHAATLRQDANVVRATLCDISQGGAKLRCAEPLELDGNIVLSLSGLEPRQGVVRWQNGEFAGINFNGLLPLGELVRWLQEQRGPDCVATGN